MPMTGSTEWWQEVNDLLANADQPPATQGELKDLRLFTPGGAAEIVLAAREAAQEQRGSKSPSV
jgi:hypothetical protein